MWLCILGSVTGAQLMVPEASACAVSDSVSGPVSAPSCPVLGSRPWTSSFTVYTNNSIYKGITPGKRGRDKKAVLQICDCDLLMSCRGLVQYYTTSSNCLLGLCLFVCEFAMVPRRHKPLLFPGTLLTR